MTLVFVAFLLGGAIRQHRVAAWSPARWLAYGVLSVWLVATLGVTIYPIQDMDVRFWERWETQSIIPLAGTIESFGNMRDRTMSQDELAALEAKIAADLEIPVDEVNLNPRISGISLSTALRDPVGNLLLFIPFGLFAPAALHLGYWRRVALAAAAISTAIELSQLLFGLGSLASIDDVLFNTLGALLGYATWLGAARIAQDLRTAFAS